jgi:mannose-6-phosphate isomerase-like protein (cupin superfamily)
MTTASGHRMQTATYRKSDDQRRFCVADVAFVLKVTGEESGGACALVEVTIPPEYAGAGPHRHQVTTAVFYVLHGVIAFTIGQETVIARSGDVVRVPPHTAFRLWNPTLAAATYLTFLTPAGFEQYFVELAELMRDEPVWPPADMSQVWALAARYDLAPV